MEKLSLENAFQQLNYSASRIANAYHDAARRLDGRELRRERRERRVGIGRHDGHAIVRFEKIQYLVP